MPLRARNGHRRSLTLKPIPAVKSASCRTPRARQQPCCREDLVMARNKKALPAEIQAIIDESRTLRNPSGRITRTTEATYSGTHDTGEFIRTLQRPWTSRLSTEIQGWPHRRLGGWVQAAGGQARIRTPSLQALRCQARRLGRRSTQVRPTRGHGSIRCLALVLHTEKSYTQAELRLVQRGKNPRSGQDPQPLACCPGSDGPSPVSASQREVGQPSLGGGAQSLTRSCTTPLGRWVGG